MLLGLSVEAPRCDAHRRRSSRRDAQSAGTRACLCREGALLRRLLLLPSTSRSIFHRMEDKSQPRGRLDGALISDWAHALLQRDRVQVQLAMPLSARLWTDARCCSPPWLCSLPCTRRWSRMRASDKNPSRPWHIDRYYGDASWLVSFTASRAVMRASSSPRAMG